MSMMKMAGKTSDNKAVAVACNDNGNVKTNRIWEQDVFTLLNEIAVRDTTAITTHAEGQELDLSPFAFVSLRINNSLDSDIQINLYDDSAKSTSGWMKNIDGEYVSITIGKGFTMLTPDDFPALKYCKYLKMRIVPKNAPTTGSLTIKAIGKR